jgi:hypothetical protein
MSSETLNRCISDVESIRADVSDAASRTLSLRYGDGVYNSLSNIGTRLYDLKDSLLKLKPIPSEISEDLPPLASDYEQTINALETEISEIVRVARDNPDGLREFLILNFPKEWGLTKAEHKSLLSGGTPKRELVEEAEGEIEPKQLEVPLSMLIDWYNSPNAVTAQRFSYFDALVRHVRWLEEQETTRRVQP